MFRIDYNYVAAQRYADAMIDKVDEVIQNVLSPGFAINHTFRNGRSVSIVVDPQGFTKSFLDKFQKRTGLRQLLQGDITCLNGVVDRVRANSGEHTKRLTFEKYDRCYRGNANVDDFNAIMHYIFVECGYEKPEFVDKSTIVDSINLKICPYCGQSFIGSVSYPRSNGSIHVARAQIDHFFPKVQYPFLALSYANFVPSCAMCNQSHKHIEDVVDNHGRMRMMSPYVFDETKFSFGFGLKRQGWFNDDNIEVKTHFNVKTPDDVALRDGYEHILGIDKLYESHNDIVLDVIVRKAIAITAQYVYYNQGLNIAKAYLDRYITAIYGFELDPNNDRRRIMSKFIRDVVWQVDAMTRNSIGRI